MNKIDNIGSIIRFHRRKAGLTQKQLATLAGVGKSAVFDIEKEKITIRLNTLTAILSVLNISLEPESPLMEQWNMEKQLP
ncbi:MAG: helix-turn-helix transcriptional regulator [Candidatus Marinimicrobia bacterium]|nr:helix-turn-helix transcriptional regulator [Candidatus Neomarinimicrobiota bacterium]